MKNTKMLKFFAVIELLMIMISICYDFFLPTIVIIVIGGIFLLLRKEKLSVLGFHRQQKTVKFVLSILAFAAFWSLVDYGILLPVLNHVTGVKQDLSTFVELKGNIGLLLFLLAASWTLAALGEELAYRGFVQNRLTRLFADRRIGIIIAVVISSILFGFAHTEQGITGVLITTADAIFFSILKYKYNNLWASVLAHGFMNSIGIITFYFTGPIYGLW
jgi:membrane protease YdiL (CAAX protease family)